MVDTNPKCNQKWARYLLTTAIEIIITFILEIIGVFFGAFLAFRLDNRRERQAEDKERVRLLSLIRREVADNEGVLKGMVEVERDGLVGVPSARPMRSIWEGITEKLAILTNDELLEEATFLYFDLANLDGILDLYRERVGEYHYATPKEQARMKPTLNSQRTHYVNYIKDAVLPQIPVVLKLIDAELDDKRPESDRVPSRNGGKRVP